MFWNLWHRPLALSQIDYGPIDTVKTAKRFACDNEQRKGNFGSRVGVCVWLSGRWAPPPHPSPSFQNALPPLNKYSAFFLVRSRSQTWRLPDVLQYNRRLKRQLDLMNTIQKCFKDKKALRICLSLNSLKRIAVQKKKGKFVLMRLKSSVKRGTVFKAWWSDHAVTERR